MSKSAIHVKSSGRVEGPAQRELSYSIRAPTPMHWMSSAPGGWGPWPSGGSLSTKCPEAWRCWGLLFKASPFMTRMKAQEACVEHLHVCRGLWLIQEELPSKGERRTHVAKGQMKRQTNFGFGCQFHSHLLRWSESVDTATEKREQHVPGRDEESSRCERIGNFLHLGER